MKLVKKNRAKINKIFGNLKMADTGKVDYDHDYFGEIYERDADVIKELKTEDGAGRHIGFTKDGMFSYALVSDFNLKTERWSVTFEEVDMWHNESAGCYSWGTNE